MNLELSELKIIEQLLQNRLNASFEAQIVELLHKVRKEIDKSNNRIERTTEWMDSDGRHISTNY